MKITGKRLAVVAVAVAVLVALGLALRPNPVPVDVGRVERGALAVTVDDEGETRVRERYVVSAPVAGELLRIGLEPGDRVRAGDTVVARFQPSAPLPLDPRSRAQATARVRAAQAAVGRARAERQAAEAESELAGTELERVRRLAEEGIVAQERLDVAATEAASREEAARAARFAETAATHDLEQAEAALYETAGDASTGTGTGAGEGGGAAAGRGTVLELRSPVDGVVLVRRRESAAVVPAGEPLLEIGDADRLEIVSDLLSTDAVRVSAGDPVWIEQWGGDEPLAGQVRRVEPFGFTKLSALGVEEQRVNVIIDFTDPADARRLGDGYRVEVRVVVWQAGEVVKTPASALFRRRETEAGSESGGPGWAVFVVDGDRARATPVEIGHRNGLEAEVLSGLEPGTEVVVHPSDSVTDGGRIERREG